MKYNLILGSSGVGKTYLANRIQDLMDADEIGFGQHTIYDDGIVCMISYRTNAKTHWEWSVYRFRKFVDTMNKIGIVPWIIGCSYNCLDFARDASNVIVISAKLKNQEQYDELLMSRENPHKPDFKHLDGKWIINGLDRLGVRYDLLIQEFNGTLVERIVERIENHTLVEKNRKYFS